MKKILVPCDFSEQAVNAFRFALDLAKQAKGEVHLVNVVELPVMHDTVLMPVLSFEEALLKELREKAEKQFEKLITKYADDVKVKSTVEFGATSVMIEDYASEKEIDLIVMGTRGASGVREFLIGSNTEKVVRRVACPVIAIKKHVKVEDIKTIVFPNTLEQEQEDLVRHVKELQSLFGATIHVVWINTPSAFIRDTITWQRMNEFAKRFMLKDYTLNIFNDVFEENGVINFAHHIKADMIAMGTHGRKGIAHVLSGSVAEDVVNHVDCPIWTYTIKKS